MGGLLVSLAPYFAPVLIETFRKAIAPLAMSANTSIAIIACFTFLSHFSGLGNMPTFVESLPVINHFTAHLRPFLAQISGIVRAMSPFGLQFHKVLLRSLLPLFRDSLNFHIVAAVSGILARFPEQLLPDILGHPTVFGHLLLTNRAFETLITSEHKRAIFERAEAVLATDGTSNTAEFERAIETIMAIRRHPEFRDEVMKFATQWLQRSFPPHVRRLLMPIAVDFSTLRPGQGDSSNDICAKIAALGHFSPSHDECILSKCAPLLAWRDQVFVSVFELFASCLAVVTKHSDTMKQILQHVLGGTEYSWVQRVSVLGLIEGLNQYEISVGMPEYILACVNFAVVSAFFLRWSWTRLQ
jgi:hypothetical protein